MNPHDDFVVVSLSPMQHVTLCYTGIGLWEVTGHCFVTKAALEDLEDPKDPPIRVAMRMAIVAQRPAMVHRVGRVIFLDVECPSNGCP